MLNFLRVFFSDQCYHNIFMSGAILPLPQYTSMVRCSVKAQEQFYLYLSSQTSATISAVGLTFSFSSYTKTSVP
jgi:hypothetical protein